MERKFYEIKKDAKINLNFIVAPIVCFFLLLFGQIFGSIIVESVSSLFNVTVDWNKLEFKLLTFLGILIVTVFWGIVVERSKWQALGFFKKDAFKEFGKGYLFGIILLTGCVLIMMLFGSVKITGFVFSPKILLSFIMIALAWIIQSSAEEVLTRGWLLSSVSAKNSVHIGVMVSSLFFVAVHLGNNAISILPVLDLFLFSLLAALYMIRQNSIWGVCGIHSAWNCFQGSVFAFRVSGHTIETAFIQVETMGPTWLSGGDFGVEGSIVSVIVQLLIVIWLINDLHKKKKLENVLQISDTTEG